MTRNVQVFGDCRVDVAARELRRGGDLVELPPKVFDCLAYLIERRERAVGRDELVASVWGKTEITDTLLGQTILKARRAVGDSADEQKVIRTIPRFGYAWVASTVEETFEESPAAGASASSRPSLTIIAALALVAIIVAASFKLSRRSVDGPAVAIAPGAAAVLPVEVQAPAEWSWVRLGLMDAIATRLRDGAQAVVPSDNVVALVRSAGGVERPDLREAAGAKLLVVPSATWNASGWNVHLELRGGDAPVGVDAHNADVLLAGRAAADRLLSLLGKTPPPDANDPDAWSDAKLLQRAEAAVLTNDLDAARRILDSAPEALQRSAEYGLRRAHLDFRAGDFEAAESRLRSLLAEASAESAPVLRARVLNGIGHVEIRRGDAAAAMSAYVEAAALLRDRNAPDDLGQAHMGRGIAAQVRGDDREARAAYSQARIAFDIAGDTLALARTDANEGMLEAARDRYSAAVPVLDRAAVRFERFGTLNELAMTVDVEIAAQLALLQPREALAASERAWPVRERLGDAGIRHALIVHRALALEANGRRREAIALLEDVGAHADPKHEVAVLAFARAALAKIELASGDAARASDLALAAIPALAGSDDVRDRSAAWLTATRALRMLGRPAAAAEQVDAFSGWARSAHQPAAELLATLARAEQRAGSGGESSVADYERALGLASDRAVPADIAEVAVSYGGHLIAADRLEEATAVVGQTARWTDRDLDCALLQARLYASLGQREAWQQALKSAQMIAGDRAIPRDVTLFEAPFSSGSP